MLYRQDVARLVRGGCQRPPQAQPACFLANAWVAVAVERLHANPTPQVRLPEDEVPALARPEVRGGQGQVRQGVVGTVGFQHLAEDVGGEVCSSPHSGCFRLAFAGMSAEEDQPVSRFDAAVIGSGQAGNPLSQKLADQGWPVALVGTENLAGSCGNGGPYNVCR
jgi:hypothetical protein